MSLSMMGKCVMPFLPRNASPEMRCTRHRLRKCAGIPRRICRLRRSNEGARCFSGDFARIGFSRWGSRSEFDGGWPLSKSMFDPGHTSLTLALNDRAGPKRRCLFFVYGLFMSWHSVTICAVCYARTPPDSKYATSEHHGSKWRMTDPNDESE